VPWISASAAVTAVNAASARSPHLWWRSGRIQNAPYVAEMSAVRLRRNGEVHLLARDAGAVHVGDVHRDPVEPETMRKRLQPLHTQSKVDQAPSVMSPAMPLKGSRIAIGTAGKVIRRPPYRLGFHRRRERFPDRSASAVRGTAPGVVDDHFGIGVQTT
jgi:hypothetical protein